MMKTICKISIFFIFITLSLPTLPYFEGESISWNEEIREGYHILEDASQLEFFNLSAHDLISAKREPFIDPDGEQGTLTTYKFTTPDCAKIEIYLERSYQKQVYYQYCNGDQVFPKHPNGPRL